MLDAKLDVFDRLMLVSMKLHLSFGDQDLAYRFGINQSMASINLPKLFMFYTQSCHA